MLDARHVDLTCSAPRRWRGGRCGSRSPDLEEYEYKIKIMIGIVKLARPRSSMWKLPRIWIKLTRSDVGWTRMHDGFLHYVLVFYALFDGYVTQYGIILSLFGNGIVFNLPLR